ncbi:MAG: alpha/beta fold hydrolase [Actinobacteria bacterium]|nr:alpha/beta fold hydrolase [Actinomycetota bacterium]
MAGDNDGIRGQKGIPGDTGGKPDTPFVPGQGIRRGQAPKTPGSGEAETPGSPAQAAKGKPSESSVPPPQAQTEPPAGRTRPAGEPAQGPPAAQAPPRAADYDVYIPERRVKKWMILLALGVVCLVVSFIVIKGATRPGVTYEKVTFETQAYDEDPVTISGLLMKPAEGVKGKVPAVVFAHGITGSKEWYIQMTRPLVEEGFIVLSIDLRGHGGSSGHSTFGYDEVKDMWAAADYLRENVPEVDPDCIVAVGHSLGGITATRAGALQPEEKFSAVVAVYCWTGWKEALEDLLGPIDDLTGRAWWLTGFSRHVDINAPDFERKYSVLDIIDDTHPPNYLLTVGRADELISVEQEEKILEETTFEARRTGPEEKVKDGYTYGDFASGTARRLVLTGDNHPTELVGGIITLETINWIKLNSGMEITGDGVAPFLWTRILGILMLVLGLLFLSTGTMSLVRDGIFPGGGGITVDPPWGTHGDQGVWEVLLYAVPVVAASYLALPAAKALGIGPLIPYAGVNEMSVFFLSRTIVLLPVFVALAVIVTLKAGGFRGLLEAGLKPTLARWGKSAGYSLIPLGIIIVVVLLLGGPLLLPRAFARLPVYFLIGVACIGSGLWLEDYLFYKLAYLALERPEEQGGFRVLAVRAVVLDMVLIGALLPLMKGLGVTVNFRFELPLVVLLLLAIPAFFFLAHLSVRLRRLTGGSLAFAVLMTVLLVWLLTGPIGVRGF